MRSNLTTMNGKSLTLILMLPILLISCSTYQTTGRSRMIAPNSSFCFICCACIGNGALEILDSTRFKISYTEGDRKEERIIEEAQKEANAVLEARRPALEHIANVLIEKEYLDGDELRRLLAEARTPSLAPPPAGNTPAVA